MDNSSIDSEFFKLKQHVVLSARLDTTILIADEGIVWFLVHRWPLQLLIEHTVFLIEEMRDAGDRTDVLYRELQTEPFTTYRSKLVTTDSSFSVDTDMTIVVITGAREDAVTALTALANEEALFIDLAQLAFLYGSANG